MKKPERWGELDFSRAPADLPPPGEYEGRVAAVRLSEKDDTLWMAVTYCLDGQTAIPAAEIGAIAARDGSAYKDRVADGYRLLRRLAEATFVELDKINDPFDLPAAFDGRALTIEVGRRTRDGVPELVVRKLKPPF
jgi:hypothetical protein